MKAPLQHRSSLDKYMITTGLKCCKSARAPVSARADVIRTSETNPAKFLKQRYVIVGRMGFAQFCTLKESDPFWVSSFKRIR